MAGTVPGADGTVDGDDVDIVFDITSGSCGDAGKGLGLGLSWCLGRLG